MSKRCHTRVFSGILALATCGCVFGQVKSASDDEPLEGVTITARSACAGAGCGETLHAQHTDEEGVFAFDGYGDFQGPQNRKFLSPLSGREAFPLTYAKSGFTTRTVMHRPTYTAQTYQGKTYQSSNVPLVYLCRTGARDSDGDGICDQAEARYGTDPNRRDSDGDGFSDGAELFGLGDLDLASYGADPRHKDIFVEVDYYPEFEPSQAALDRVIAAFASAPVTNLDGTTGIRLHILLDDKIDEADVDPLLQPVITDLMPIRTKYRNPHRASAFHYALFADRLPDERAGMSVGTPGDTFIIALGVYTDRGPDVQAASFMHEFGHNLGLHHGGHEEINMKPHYLSIMNYVYARGLMVDGVDGILDFSRLRIASVNEASLREDLAFAPGPGTTEAQLARYSVRLCHERATEREACLRRAWLGGNASQNLDFDRNGTIATSAIAVDLDASGDAGQVFAASQNDWQNLVYSGREHSLGDMAPAFGTALSLRSSESTAKLTTCTF